MSYPYRNQTPYPGAGYPTYPSAAYPPRPEASPPYPGFSLSHANSPYPPSAPSYGYNPTMGNTPYLPPGYPTFQPPASGYSQPPASGYSQPPVSEYPQPPASGYSQPPVSEYPQSSASGYPQPPASGYSQPSASGYPQTSISGYPQPSTGSTVPGYQPSGSYPSSGNLYPVMNPSSSSPDPARYSPSSRHSSSLYSPGRQYPSSGMANYQGEGTVKPYPAFDPNQDAQALRKAMKGLGTDEKAIISVLANRSNSQRVYIGVAFKQLFGKDLIEDLKSELSGKFEDVIIGLMLPLSDFLAKEAHRAMSGIGTDEDTLIEILCTRTNHEIWQINEAYRRLYGKALEEDIRGDTSGHFQRLLVSSCTGARSEAQADPVSARADAQALYEAGVGKWGTDESTFNSILAARSFHHLQLVFYEYQKLTGHTVAKAIDSEMSGDLKAGMLAIAKSVENRPAYFAEKLYKAMKGLGTDDKTLIRIVVSRCEIDMVQIKAEYERNYGKPLEAAIADDTSGDYKRVLVSLVSG